MEMLLLWNFYTVYEIQKCREELKIVHVDCCILSCWTIQLSLLGFLYRWHMGSWGPCSATCGVGIQTREVYCLHPEESPAPAEECRDEKPHALQACNQFDCPPGWHIEDWQQVQQTGDPMTCHAYDSEEPCSALL